MTLEFQKYGCGEPIIVLHGLLGSRENWHSICQRLAGHFEVYALDQRNHGHSPHSPQMTYADLAADVEEFIDSTLSSSAHLLGHSMGGKTAMKLALDTPEKVKSLIVVDIAPRAYSRRHDRILSALLGLNLVAYRSRREIEEALAPSIPDLATRRFLIKSVELAPDGRLCWRLGLQEIADAYPNLADAVTGEHPYGGACLFLRGERSDYVSEADLPQIRRLFPLAQLKAVPVAGHWIQAENPDGVIRIVTEFLHGTA